MNNVFLNRIDLAEDNMGVNRNTNGLYFDLRNELTDVILKRVKHSRTQAGEQIYKKVIQGKSIRHIGTIEYILSILKRQEKYYIYDIMHPLLTFSRHVHPLDLDFMLLDLILECMHRMSKMSSHVLKSELERTKDETALIKYLSKRTKQDLINSHIMNTENLNRGVRLSSLSEVKHIEDAIEDLEIVYKLHPTVSNAENVKRIFDYKLSLVDAKRAMIVYYLEKRMKSNKAHNLMRNRLHNSKYALANRRLRKEFEKFKEENQTPFTFGNKSQNKSRDNTGNDRSNAGSNISNRTVTNLGNNDTVIRLIRNQINLENDIGNNGTGQNALANRSNFLPIMQNELERRGNVIKMSRSVNDKLNKDNNNGRKRIIRNDLLKVKEYENKRIKNFNNLVKFKTINDLREILNRNNNDPEKKRIKNAMNNMKIVRNDIRSKRMKLNRYVRTGEYTNAFNGRHTIPNSNNRLMILKRQAYND